MKKIYFLLTKTPTIVSRLIYRFSNDISYTHMAISIDQTLQDFYSFGRKGIYNPINAGFVREQFNKGLYSRFPNCDVCILELDITEEQYIGVKNTIDNFIKSKDSFKYNFIGLFFAKQNKILERENAYFCSSFVSYVLTKNNINLFDKHYTLVAPNDYFNLYKSGNLNQIYSGNMIGLDNLSFFVS